jgi:hypothetical protein
MMNDEQKTLREFHVVLEAAVPLIPDASVGAMLESKTWQRVIAAANQTLQRIGPAEPSI